MSAEALVANLFEANGWNVDRPPDHTGKRPDLLVRKGRKCFVVAIKALAESRADRVIPLLSQAILQAQANALDAGKAQPLAVISVDNVSQSLSQQVSSFVQHYAPSVAVGLLSPGGFRYFQGGGLEGLNAEAEQPQWHGQAPLHQPVNLFSDLNQWMLKVLLAPEISDHLLRAPRQKYQSGFELAAAAAVSPMSASRFLKQLRKEGYLDDSSRYIALVRRADLFRRWRSASIRPSHELPMRFLIRGSAPQHIRSLVASHDGQACLGLFAAADALRLGHVSGVPPYICVPKLPRPNDKKWKALVAAAPSEKPDIIVRQAAAPKSAFRGAVSHDGLIISDVIQLWLDVANHPSRGEEQAELIYEKILRPLLGNSGD